MIGIGNGVISYISIFTKLAFYETSFLFTFNAIMDRNTINFLDTSISNPSLNNN